MKQIDDDPDWTTPEIPTRYKTCLKCGKTLGDQNFYNFKNGKKDEICKQCITGKINYHKPETFLQVLERYNIPYIKEEWEILAEREIEKNKYTGMSIFGRYYSKMKLNGFKNYTFKDSEMLNKEYEKRKELYIMEKETVNHPSHYNREGALECIDEMILVFGKEAVKNFCLCNSWKYRYRAADKNGLEDLKKSDWYLRKYQELCEEKNKVSTPIITIPCPETGDGNYWKDPVIYCYSTQYTTTGNIN